MTLFTAFEKRNQTLAQKPEQNPGVSQLGKGIKQIMDKSKNISWMPMIVIAAAAFVGALDATFMNVSMSQVVNDLDTNLGTIQKMVTFYTLTTASLLLISAKLQDIIGKRKIFLLGIIIYGIGDLIAALSPNAMVLFTGWSLLEGIGSALMGPALISIIIATYDGIYRTKALAVVSTMAGVAVAIGPLFGGVVTTFFSWCLGFGFELIIIVEQSVDCERRSTHIHL